MEALFFMPKMNEGSSKKLILIVQKVWRWRWRSDVGTSGLSKRTGRPRYPNIGVRDTQWQNVAGPLMRWTELR